MIEVKVKDIEHEELISQKTLYDSGNELAAYAAKQINYHVMGYYPITPSTQIAENLDLMKAKGLHDISLMPAEGEHSAAGICYGASVGGGRVFNATSANGLLYALEQLPVQSGTRFPMVMNVACRTVSGPLCIKGDHSDIMYTLNTGWIILFANTPQAVYDMNICGLKLGERVNLPVIIAFDGFFTSHQKQKCQVFEHDETVQKFIGDNENKYNILDINHPISIGSYMNEPDIINNKYQLHMAMEQAKNEFKEIFTAYEKMSGRRYSMIEKYKTEDASIVLFVLGSAYYTAMEAVDRLRSEGIKAGVFTLNLIRPFPIEDIVECCKQVDILVVADRQDSYGANGGNMSLEIRAALQSGKLKTRVISRVYGLGGKDFYVEDAYNLMKGSLEPDVKNFDYYGIYSGNLNLKEKQYFAPITKEKCTPGKTAAHWEENENCMKVSGGRINDTCAMEKRLAPGHGACPGCGIPVNVNLLLRGIEGPVVLLFQTGCGYVVSTGYPKTAFKVPFVHNLFQNGAATLAGLVEMYHQKQKRGEMSEESITFIMVSGDGGMDIGMGSALGTALRNNNLIIFEYDNGGYMNTGYQLSYSTPKGAKSSTSHVGKYQYGKNFMNKDMPMIMAGTHIPYVATVAESNPTDFIQKAAKASAYAKNFGTAYIRALSACPLNWGDHPETERKVIGKAVDCCYFPLYEIENGHTKLSYNPEARNKKIPVSSWLKCMGRTKHLLKDEYKDVCESIQYEIDRRWERLKAMNDSDIL